MDFSRPHIHEESVACKSKIRYIPVPNSNSDKKSLDEQVIEAANQAAQDIIVGPVDNPDPRLIDASLYPERSTPQSEIIQAGDLVVIFESFDNLNFVYAQSKEIFSNRNGHFHHDDFLGKPFGCKIRSRNNRGYGFCYLLKPTPELWARSLNHRTQIVHELDASMICFYLHLRPNMVVCETGTGSGAMSHAILRTIAPKGQLHTFEFNATRAQQARQEFAKNGLSHLVTVYHKDVCGKAPVVVQDETTTTATAAEQQSAPMGGFGLQGQSVHAVFLDLPEPWLAVPHAAFCLKPNARIASYSPCVEQSQRTVAALRRAGFHSIKTMEFRLRENYVDEMEYELPPKDKRVKVEGNPYLVGATTTTTTATSAPPSGGEDTGAEADNEKSEMSETELSQGTAEETAAPNDDTTTTATKTAISAPSAAPTPVPPPPLTSTTTSGNAQKRKKLLVARPFVNMRGHTAFLTFATAGNIPQPDPNQDLKKKKEETNKEKS